MLLVECNVLEQVKVINEGTKGKTKVRLQGKFQKCDEQNNNGRIYPKSILESQVKAIQEKIGDRSLVGALDHPTNDAIHLSQASHLITKLWVEKNGDVMGECEILSTPNGKIVEALLNDGVKLGISSRGIGSVTEGIKGKLVNEDFKLITFDLVSDPSTRGAFPQISESMRENSERAQKIVSKHKKDRVLLTMLESKINESMKQSKKKAKKEGDSSDDSGLGMLDGKPGVTMKDVLIGRGVIKKGKKKAREGYDVTGEKSRNKEEARKAKLKPGYGERKPGDFSNDSVWTAEDASEDRAQRAFDKREAAKKAQRSSTDIIGDSLIEGFKKVCWGDRYDESKMSDRDVQRQERRRQPNKKRFESPSNFAAMTGSHYSDRGRGSVHPDGSMQHPEDIEIEDKRGERLRKRKALQATLGEALKKVCWGDRYDEVGEVKKRNKAHKRRMLSYLGKTMGPPNQPDSEDVRIGRNVLGRKHGRHDRTADKPRTRNRAEYKNDVVRGQAGTAKPTFTPGDSKDPRGPDFAKKAQQAKAKFKASKNK